MNYEVPTKEMLAKIKGWRESMVKDFNSNVVHNPFLDSTLFLRYIQASATDTQEMMQWIEILTHKVEQLEKVFIKDPNTTTV